MPAAASLKNWPLAASSGSPNRRMLPVPSFGPRSSWYGPGLPSSDDDRDRAVVVGPVDVLVVEPVVDRRHRRRSANLFEDRVVVLEAERRRRVPVRAVRQGRAHHRANQRSQVVYASASAHVTGSCVARQVLHQLDRASVSSGSVWYCCDEAVYRAVVELRVRRVPAVRRIGARTSARGRRGSNGATMRAVRCRGSRIAVVEAVAGQCPRPACARRARDRTCGSRASCRRRS